MQIRLTSTKARHFVVALATVGWLALSGAVTPAPAALISGNFSLSGTDTYDETANTINILTNTVTVANGSFAGAGILNTSLIFDVANPIHYDALTGLLFHGNVASGLTFT